MLNTIKLFIFVFCLSHGIPTVLPAEVRPLAYEIGGMSLAVIFLMLTGEWILRATFAAAFGGDFIGETLDAISNYFIGIFDEVNPGVRALWKDRLNLLDERHKIYRELLMSEADKTKYRLVMLVNMIFASGLMLSFFTGVLAYMQREIGMEFDTAGLNFAGVLTFVSTVYGFFLYSRFNRAIDQKYRAEYESRYEEVTIDNTTFIRAKETAAAGA